MVGKRKDNGGKDKEDRCSGEGEDQERKEGWELRKRGRKKERNGVYKGGCSGRMRKRKMGEEG
jgi:hypothetical protein